MKEYVSMIMGTEVRLLGMVSGYLDDALRTLYRTCELIKERGFDFSKLNLTVYDNDEPSLHNKVMYSVGLLTTLNEYDTLVENYDLTKDEMVALMFIELVNAEDMTYEDIEIIAEYLENNRTKYGNEIFDYITKELMNVGEKCLALEILTSLENKFKKEEVKLENKFTGNVLYITYEKEESLSCIAHITKLLSENKSFQAEVDKDLNIKLIYEE